MAISKLDSLYDQLDNTNLSSGATDIEDRSLMQNGDDITYTSGYINVNIGNTPSSEGDYLLHGLDVPITTTDFVLDFDYYRVSGGTNCFAGLVFRSNLSGESTENSTAGDYIRTSPNANGTSMDMYWHNDGDSSETAIGYLTGLNSAGNWNYLRLTRTNGTTIKLERFSSSARSGSADATVTATNLSATWGLSLKYIGGYCAFAGSNAGNGIHERFQNIDLSSTTKGKTAKQRVVETFSGLNLDTNRWGNVVQITGSSGAVAMNDSVDGGFKVSTGANDEAILAFDDIRQFNHLSCGFVAVTRTTTSNIAQGQNRTGIKYDNDGTFNAGDLISMECGYNNQKISLFTASATGYERTTSSIDRDTVYHSYKGLINNSSATLTIDGALECTTSTHLPTKKMQPFIYNASGSVASSSDVTYLEVFNT